MRPQVISNPPCGLDGFLAERPAGSDDISSKGICIPTCESRSRRFGRRSRRRSWPSWRDACRPKFEGLFATDRPVACLALWRQYRDRTNEYRQGVGLGALQVRAPVAGYDGRRNCMVHSDTRSRRSHES